MLPNFSVSTCISISNNWGPFIARYFIIDGFGTIHVKQKMHRPRK